MLARVALLLVLLSQQRICHAEQWWGADDDIVNDVDDDELNDDRFPQLECSGGAIKRHRSANWTLHHESKRYNITTTTDSSCEYVQNWCTGDGVAMFAYLKFHFCNMSAVPFLSLIILICWQLLLLNVLATTADDFLVVQLQTLSAYMKLSPEIAGITLVAFGNAAPDIFAAKSALSGKDPDFPLLLSGILGGSIFISTVVLGTVCMVANAAFGDSWRIERFSFYRDYVFYIGALVSFLAIATDGEISDTEPLVLMILYLAYITLVVVLAAFQINPFQQREPIIDLEADVALSSDDMADSDSTLKSRLLTQGHTGGSDEYNSSGLLASEWTGIVESASLNAKAQGDGAAEVQVAGGAQVDDEKEKMAGLDWDPDASNLSKFTWAVLFPFSVLRWLSIPAADKRWSRRRRIWTAVSIPFAVLMIVFDSPHNEINNFSYITFLRTGSPTYAGSDGTGRHSASAFANPPPYDDDLARLAFPLANLHSNSNSSSNSGSHIHHGQRMPLVPILLVAGAVVGGASYAATRDDELPRFYPAIVLVGFLSTIMWLDVIAAELVAIIQSFGIMLNVSTSILGLTVLAMGNCVGDLVANCAVSKKSPNMGVAACIGSPMIMNIIALGVATLWYLASNPSGSSSISTPINAQARVAYVFLCVSLISSAIIIPLCNFKSDKHNFFSYYLFSLYALFLLISCLVEGGVISRKSICCWSWSNIQVSQCQVASGSHDADAD